MSSNLNEFAQFLGHFHPMLVHLPVGGLVLLSVLELLATRPQFRDLAQNRRAILAIVALGAVGAAACGWLLAWGGGYDPQLLDRHRWLGIAVAAACIVTLLLCGSSRRSAYWAALTVTFALLVVAGHFGSEMTHGRDYLTRHAPRALRNLLGASRQAAEADFASAASGSLYSEVVRPILEKRCVSCHGPEKQKGELRLDSLAGLQRGGQSGPALDSGHAAQSLMIKRVLLLPEEEDHMPPDGKPQPTQAEIGLLQWWINSGATEEVTAASPKPSAEVQQWLNEFKSHQTR
jgi:uncharacterized membrane protein